jgi:hypothetical protein
MREEYVGRGIVEFVSMSRLGCRRIAQQPLETTPTDRDIDPEDAVAIKVGFGVPTRVVMDDQSGKRESLILRQIALGVIEEEGVTPSCAGAPLSSLAVRVTTPERPLTYSMISVSVTLPW